MGSEHYRFSCQGVFVLITILKARSVKSHTSSGGEIAKRPVFQIKFVAVKTSRMALKDAPYWLIADNGWLRLGVFLIFLGKDWYDDLIGPTACEYGSA